MDTTSNTEKAWKQVIRPGNNLFTLNVREIWEYRDLLVILVRRDLIAIYKQTILGPLWFFLQPALSSLVYFLVFSRAAGVSTDGIPPVLFYLSGLAVWGYFAECTTRTASFLKDNTVMLQKVYFPKLIIPLSLITSNLIRFAIQLALFFIAYAYYMYFGAGQAMSVNSFAYLFPLLVILTGLLGFGLGLIVSSLTTRYKDLMHLVTFGVQLLMFVSSVVIPVSTFSSEVRAIVRLNPMAGIIESFRYGFFGKGYFDWGLLAYDAAAIILVVLVGVVLFNAVEKTFVDSM